MFEALFKALLGDDTKNGPSREVARHLARVYLYSLANTDALYPDVKDKLNILIKRMADLKMPIELVEGIRSVKRQDQLFLQVPKITNAKGLQSYHQYGLAFDVYFINYGYNPPSGWWDILGSEGKKIGLTWGGDFPSPDRPHFEWTPNLKWQDLETYFKLS